LAGKREGTNLKQWGPTVQVVEIEMGGPKVYNSITNETRNGKRLPGSDKNGRTDIMQIKI